MRILAAGLVAAAALGGSYLTLPSAARAQPAGSYSETCRGSRASGGVLSATCLDAQGRSHATSLNYQSCRGDIANRNGALSCTGGTPAPSARGGAGAYYPQSSGETRRQPYDRGYDQAPAYPDRGYERDRGYDSDRSYGRDRSYDQAPAYPDRGRDYDRDRGDDDNR